MNAGLRAYGVTIGLRAGAPLLDALCARATRLGWTRDDSGDTDLNFEVRCAGGQLDLTCNGETLWSTRDRHALADAFENSIKIEMALRAREYLFVHAGVVGWRGGAIVLPGRSRAGKTTLVEALVRVGAEYYSDEFAVIDCRGLVHPYAIPLAIRARGGRPADSVPIESIGGRVGCVPLPVARVVLTHYKRRARWRPQPVSPAMAMLALVGNTVAARQPPDRTLPVLRRSLERATVVRSPRGDARAVARALLTEIL